VTARDLRVIIPSDVTLTKLKSLFLLCLKGRPCSGIKSLAPTRQSVASTCNDAWLVAIASRAPTMGFTSDMQSRGAKIVFSHNLQLVH